MSNRVHYNRGHPSLLSSQTLMHIAYLAELNNPHTQKWVGYFARRGDRVSVLCDTPGPRPHQNIEVYHPEWSLPMQIVAFRLFPRPYGNNMFKWSAYRPLLHRLNPDVVHAMEAVGYGYTLARCGSFPKVLTPWGNDIFFDPQHSRVARFMVSRALRAADVITTNMPNLAEYLESAFAIPGGKVQAFSWGVDQTVFNPTGREEARRKLAKEWNIPEDATVIISARRFDPYWGAQAIVKAAAAILETVPDCYFVILRAGGDERFFERETQLLVQGHLTRDRVRLVERYLTPAQMADHLRAADGFLSYPQTDLLSISVVEGMACGAVPIVADLPAYHTRLENEKTAFMAPVGQWKELTEAIRRFLLSRERWEEIRAFNWKTVQREDNWLTQAEKMADIYESLLGRQSYR